MPTVTRTDGVQLYWQARGEGPPVVLASAWAGPPEIFSAFIEDMAADHRVVTYDPRGMGRSTRTGPYDMDTDVADLVAVLEDAGGDTAVVVCVGDGSNRAAHAAALRPDLIRAVVCPAGVPLVGELFEGTSSLASPGVIEALVQQLKSDYRGALRTITAFNNPQMSEEEIRERVDNAVEYCPQEAARARFDTWISDDAREHAAQLGDRLWLLLAPGNPWFPPDLVEALRRFYPDARIEHLPDGMISRPDSTARTVRELTRARV